jgi:4-hydroxy-3-polyprenylbenzoate decarboxylase
LAKYLLIVAREDNPELDVHDISAFLRHLLERIDWRNDVHFQTCTTIDTLDYSGCGLNEGSKVVLAAVGPKRRELPAGVPSGLRLPEGYSEPRVCLPGILAVQGPAWSPHDAEKFCRFFRPEDEINQFPLVILVEDSEFTARNLRNYLWVTFTRSNPAADIDGIGAFTVHKHWGCEGSLVIDARRKSQHAPPLEEDPAVSRRVDALAAPGGSLRGII